MSQLPSSVHAVVIGAGIHGLSTGWHLGLELERRRRGSGRDVVVLDKTGVGAGASGIACGCVRNLYMTEPLHAILRHSVDVWTYDPVALGFQQVGYVGVDEEQNLPAYERVWKSQNAAGYPSDLYAGEDARRFVRGLWPDFNTSRVGLALHERVSGYAGTRQAVTGLAGKCAQHGVRVLSGVEVTGYDVEGGRARAVLTDRGRIACDVVVWGLGAWTPRHWAHAREALTAHVPLSRRQRRDEGHVDLLAAPRGRGLLRRAVRDGRRPESPRAPRRDLRARRGSDLGAPDQGLHVRILQERQRADGPARSPGRDDAGQARAHRGHRSLRPRERRVPGGPLVRRLLLRGDGADDVAVQGAAGPSSGSGATGASARSRRTTCRCSTGWHRTSS